MRLKVKALGGWAMKFTSPGVSGVPDRIVLMPGGKLYFVEMKWGKNGLSPQQVLIHKMIRALGFRVFTIATNEQLDEFINGIQTT